MARSRGRVERDLPQEAPRQNDAYTWLLLLSVLATLAGLIFVVLDYNDYTPKPQKLTSPASISKPEPAAAAAPDQVAPAPPGGPETSPPKKGG